MSNFIALVFMFTSFIIGFWTGVNWLKERIKHGLR